MKKIIAFSFFIFTFIPALVRAEAVPGQAAPAFEAKDAQGVTHKLSDYSGKWLVLEWFNKDCPYVKKHYGSGNMQKLQTAYSAKGVQWLSVLSSAPGKEGYTDAAGTLKTAAEYKSAAKAILLDPTGTMGRAYGAKTTPHMFIINPQGQVVYAGAIDDNDSADPGVIASSKNYVAAALDAALSNKAIEVVTSKPYGCSVKY